MAAQKRGLGKGMTALLGTPKKEETGKAAKAVTENISEKDVMSVKIRLVEPNREQPRKNFSEEALQELCESIKIHGVIQPLIVVKAGEGYRIIAGERRWRAAKMAGLKEVPVVVREYTEQQISEISLIENIQRSDLSPVEEARAYRKLMDEYKMTQEALAERVSKSRTAIANTLRLLKLPEEVLLLLETGKIQEGHAKVLLGLQTKAKQEELAREIAERKLSVRETESRVRAMNKKEPQARQGLKNQVEYTAIENKLKEKLGTKVSIKRRTENAGKIEIEYFSMEDMNRILNKIR